MCTLQTGWNLKKNKFVEYIIEDNEVETTQDSKEDDDKKLEEELDEEMVTVDKQLNEGYETNDKENNVEYGNPKEEQLEYLLDEEEKDKEAESINKESKIEKYIVEEAREEKTMENEHLKEQNEYHELWVLEDRFPKMGPLDEKKEPEGSSTRINDVSKDDNPNRPMQNIEIIFTPNDNNNLLAFIKGSIGHQLIKIRLPTLQASLKKSHPNIFDDAIDLLGKILASNPHKRNSIAKALEHSYMGNTTIEVFTQKPNLNNGEVNILKSKSNYKVLLQSQEPPSINCVENILLNGRGINIDATGQDLKNTRLNSIPYREHSNFSKSTLLMDANPNTLEFLQQALNTYTKSSGHGVVMGGEALSFFYSTSLNRPP
eukprot:Gb_01036 [translate_table: standard]